MDASRSSDVLSAVATWAKQFSSVHIPAHTTQRLRADALLVLLGPEDQHSIVQEAVPTFSVRGSHSQIHFREIVRQAMTDFSKLGKFIRALCSGQPAGAPRCRGSTFNTPFLTRNGV